MRFKNLFLLLFLFAAVGIFITFFPGGADAQFLSDEERARLEAEYQKIQQEIAQWQAVLDETRDKKDSLQGDVNELNALINKATAEIRQRNVSITNIRDQIAIKESTIQELVQKIDRGRVSLANILRIQNTTDDQSIAEIVLSGESISGTFGEVEALSVVKRDLHHMFAEIRSLRHEVELEKAVLAEKQNQELNARYQIEQSRREIARNEAAKSELLEVTKDEERTYEQVLAERQRRAEQIRNALFPLRDTEGISFADALNYATYAGEKTGVRPAFILAVLSQESDLGKNVGSCFVTSLSTGDGVGKNTGRVFEQVMYARTDNPNRPNDTYVFERITRDLGLTWGSTPVSCPPGLTYYVGRGFGGAMGPSQFIPSTWAGYEDRLRRVLGVTTPNPWNAQHAVMATALFMSDLGAGAQTYTAERNAACRYYSGRSCDNRSPRNSFYGDAVIKKAEAFQDDIDFLKGVAR